MSQAVESEIKESFVLKKIFNVQQQEILTAIFLTLRIHMIFYVDNEGLRYTICNTYVYFPVLRIRIRMFFPGPDPGGKGKKVFFKFFFKFFI